MKATKGRLSADTARTSKSLCLSMARTSLYVLVGDDVGYKLYSNNNADHIV